MIWFENLSPVLQGFFGTLFTYALTALGACAVFFFKEVKAGVLNVMLGMASGIMIAASFWSLLSPAIDMFDKSADALLPVALGFIAGGAFVNGSDIFLSGMKKFKNQKSKRSALFVLAVTLHNIPEGLAVGVAFGSAGFTGASISGAIMLAVGIGLQNLPEGLCISLPLRGEGYSRKKAFFIGQASGAVEPIAGLLGAALAMGVQKILPSALAFSAGAMISVVCLELVPEAFKDKKLFASVGVILGFTLMMVLDVGLS